MRPATAALAILTVWSSTTATILPSFAVPDKIMDQQFAIALKWNKQQKWTKAQEIMVPLCREPNATPQMRVLLADTYLAGDIFDYDSPAVQAAEKGLHIAMKQMPENGRIFYDLAKWNNGRGEWQQAIDYATKALTAKHREILSLRERAIGYSHIGKPREALADMKELIKPGGRPFDDYMLEGEIEQTLKDYPAAELSFRHALALSPVIKSRLLRSLVSCLAAQKKFAEAVEETSQALKNNASDADMYEVRAIMYQQMHNNQAALADLSKAISLSPTGRFYKERAQLYKTLNRGPEAEEDLKKAAKANNTPYF